MKRKGGRKHRTGYIFQHGKTWWLQYRIDGTTHKRNLKTTDRDEAETKQKEFMRTYMAVDLVSAHALAEAKLRSVEQKTQADNEAAIPSLAVADAWTAYEKAKNRPDSSERTLQGYETTWRKFAKWLTKTHPDIIALREINADIAGGYAQQLIDDQLTASTFNQYIGFLRLVWRCLADHIRGADNPWMKITKRSVKKQQQAHRRRNITTEQFENLLASAGSADLHDLIFTLAMTGQRLIDGIMLRWDCVDFKRKVITLYPCKTARYGKQVCIPLFPDLADLLQKRRDMVAGEYAFPDLIAEHQHDQSIITKRIQQVFEKIGLTPKENRPGIKRAVAVYGAHSLRHYFATEAVSAGIPAEIVKRITGHTSDAMLEGYEHIDAAMIGGLAAKLSNNKPLATLPAPAKMVPADKVNALAQQLNAQSWSKIKKELISMTMKTKEDNQQKKLPPANVGQDRVQSNPVEGGGSKKDRAVLSETSRRAPGEPKLNLTP
ncbi:MAG: tyrosine-type recombinase/integrase [Kiritimatiellia bacterium]